MRGVGKNFRVSGLAAIMALGLAGEAFAHKTNQAVYEEPFDLAAGGASLTRGSQEGVMFSNPAVMPFGEKFHRWFGSQFTVFYNREAPQVLKAAKSTNEGEGQGGQSALVDQLFKTPLHVGAQTATSYITNNFGVGIFGRVAQDLEAKQHGPTGVPAVLMEGEGYGGAVFSVAKRVARPLALGVTVKYLYVAEPSLNLDLTDTEKIKALTSDSTTIRRQYELHRGLGADVGLLWFEQGSTVDYRWALKVDDVGDTYFGDDVEPFKQTLATGMAVTFHNSVDSLHLALDFRDILGVYEEKPFKRVYVGAKLILRNIIGFAAGFYQGIPSAGVRLDLVLVQLGFTAYGRELGSYPGEKQRNLYMAYVGFGI